MIQPPHRSVTRFFVPLVDVMMLLFCVFLLMPNIRTKIPAPDGTTGDTPARDFREEVESLERELKGRIQSLEELEKRHRTEIDVEKMKAELEKLRKEKIAALQQRLAIRVLEIDPKNGNLVVYEGTPPKRRNLTTQAAVNDMIAQHRKESANKELYYLFLFPRQNSAFPNTGQLDQYQKWFNSVPYGFDRALQ